MNEWAFAGEIKSWWDREFSTHPEWRLDRCEIEREVEGDRRRSDLAVHGEAGVRMAGELRLPDHPHSSPWDLGNLQGAVLKAGEQGSRWAFTSDGTVIVLVDTERPGPLLSRVAAQVDVIDFESRAELESARFLSRVETEWRRALGDLVPVIQGIEAPPSLALDEVFIRSLRRLLLGPAGAIRDGMNTRRTQDPGFEQELVRWMVEDQNWPHDPANWEAEVLRAAQLTAYVFATRIMFYEALRQTQPELALLQLPDADDASIAHDVLAAFLRRAKELSGDYSTIFDWDRVCEYALVDDRVVPGWRRVIEYLPLYDLANIGYDMMGRLFERLIEPTERYRWGQHYTSPDVVDLMLSFGIPDGSGALLDPAVGGGTFLVRAYVRKHVLHPELTHQELLRDLYGIDVSAFAASLATFNLAVRSLTFQDNYPQVVASSFFQVHPQQVFMALPMLGMDGVPETPVAIDTVRAAVFNPPYVRVHELGRTRQSEAAAVLRQATGRVATPASLPRASNYHVYFWLHGAQFLEEDGRLVVIAAGEWMDSDYGVALQQWLLENFRIECCIESLAEPWFSEARVGTVMVVAQRCLNEEERERNIVRFILLRRRLNQLYGPSDSQEDHIRRVDALRDQLLSTPEGLGERDDFDWSSIRQGELLRLGMEDQ